MTREGMNLFPGRRRRVDRGLLSRPYSFTTAGVALFSRSSREGASGLTGTVLGEDGTCLGQHGEDQSDRFTWVNAAVGERAHYWKRPR